MATAQQQQHGSDVTYAGWVFKEGSLVKSWKKRFLVVKRAELAYYKNTEQENKAQLLGAMTVARIEKAPDITNGLLLFSVEGRQLKLFTDTQKECDKCFQAIAQYASEQKRGGSDRSAVTPLHDYGASPDSIKHVGWLEKEGQHFKTWKKRYFVLEENVLSYTAQIGSASLGKARVIAARRDLTRPNTLVVMMEGGRELKIGGKTEAEIHEWHKALRKGIMKYGGHRSPAHGGGHMSSPGMGPSAMRSPAYHHSQQTPQRSPPPYAASSNVPWSPAGGYNQYAQQQQPPPAYSLVSHSPVNRGHEQEHSPLFGSLPEDNEVQHSSDPSPFTEEQARKVAERQNRDQHMSFRRHIILEPTQNNGSSFIECEPEQNEKPAAKPWSPKAPGTNTIMQMRLEDKLLLEELEEERQEALAKEKALLSTATQQKKKKQQEDETTSSGPCAPCCSVM